MVINRLWAQQMRNMVSLSSLEHIFPIGIFVSRFYQENLDTKIIILDTRKLRFSGPASKPSREENRTKYLYRELMYATMVSHPDICHVTKYFSRFQEYSTDEHWNHLKRILRSIKETLNIKLIVNWQGEIIQGYADVDWASETQGIESRHRVTASKYTDQPSHESHKNKVRSIQ